ncbi:MAG: putative LPS assembly protein LptD [Bacteroidia bacterium]|nr:putative LPS assembly protein LptD [Bacteroidia bacterium]
MYFSRLSVVFSFVVFPLFGQVLPAGKAVERAGFAVPEVAATLKKANALGLKDSISNWIPTDTAAFRDTTSKGTKEQSISEVVEYSAKDSLVFEEGGVARLYGKGTVNYGKLKLDAGYIQMDMDSSLLSAIGRPDSVGKIIENPVFKDESGEYNSKGLKYNFKTKKGLISQAVTQQGEGWIVSGTTKKMEDDVLCMVNGKYTTCDNHEHPHFYLDLSKAKVKPGSYIVSGPAHLVMEDVDLPLFLPFGYFPFKGKYSSGFLMPTYGDELQRGFYLSNMGYYFAFNDYVDVAIRTDIYSKGSWGIKTNSTYRKRYKYSGNFSASYVENVTGEKTLPDYAKSKDLRVNWSHSQDAKADPFRTFSASVNFATSGYTRNDLASLYNQRAFAENTKSSSVSYSQRFPESPWSLSASLSVNQSSRDSTLSVSLPGLSMNMTTIYPFKRKNAVGDERWYEKIRVGYSGRMANSISNVKEYEIMNKSLVKDWKNGIMHSVPISATFNVLNYINVNTSFSYNERWYSSSLDKFYDETNDKVVTDTTWGFNRVWDYTASVSASTKLYGMYQLNPKIFGKISQIRHVLTPDISFSYHPDFGQSKYGYWGDYSYLDNNGIEQVVSYSRYTNGLYGTPGKGKSGTVSFSLDNNVEMKLKQVTDTSINYKKVSLIDDFRFGTSYNLAADSLNWSDISASIRLKFGEKYTLNLSGSFQPYTYILNSAGNPVRTNTTQFEKYGIPGRLTGTGTQFSYTLSNDTFKKLAKLFQKKPLSGTGVDGTPNTGDVAPPANSDNGLAEEKPLDAESALYAPCTIPWSIGISYSVRYGQSTFNKQKLEYDYDFTQNLSFSGNLSLTDKWKFTASTSYNFEMKKLATMNCSVTRDLHCWAMTASFIPIGPYKSYNFSIAVKSSLLEDLKYEQHQNPRDNYLWK